MKYAFLFLLGLCLALSACKSRKDSAAQGPLATSDGVYALDASASSLQWTGSAAVGDYKLTGSIAAKGGEATLKEGKLLSGAWVSIDMRSIDHELKDLVGHLESPDFFDVKAFPEARFDLDSSLPLGFKVDEALGVIAIKGIERKQMAGVETKMENDRLRVDLTLRIDRTQFGSTYNSPTADPDASDQAIADEFTLIGILYFTKGL